MSIQNELNEYKLSLLGVSNKISSAPKKVIDGIEAIAMRLYQHNMLLKEAQSHATLGVDKKQTLNQDGDQPQKPRPGRK